MIVSSEEQANPSYFW